jgi:hypothetical protein
VERISAFLFHQGSDDDPVRLNANADKSFEGTTVLGMGFTFDDNNPDATSTTEMRELIAKNGSNAERICPYLGGEELNSTPTQAHYRYIINFENMSELEARRWPDLMGILEAKVRGTRGKHSTAEWWHFERPRHELYAAIRELPRVLSIARVGQAMAFAFLRAETVYSEQLVVFAFESNAPFAALQSRPHEVWARFLGSSMKDDLRYTPSDCFETFPFPDGWETNPALESTGKAYYDFRAALMVKNNEGLTKTYNRFHDPDETDGDIVKLRELHAAMDRAVLDAFGWADVRPTCEFLLDYEEADDDDAPSGRRKKKKPWRYRWPDDIRDEVLARLLDLNAQRAKEESAASTGATPPSPSASGKKAPRRSKKKPATSSETQTGLFGKETK